MMMVMMVMVMMMMIAIMIWGQHLEHLEQNRRNPLQQRLDDRTTTTYSHYNDGPRYKTRYPNQLLAAMGCSHCQELILRAHHAVLTLAQRRFPTSLDVDFLSLFAS